MITIETISELSWGFDNEGPSVKVWPAGADYARSLKVDPHPCYAHDREVVTDVMGEVWRMFPLSSPLTVYLLDYERLDRANGCQADLWAYKGSNERTWCPYIVFDGKRIPLMTSMTTYLCGHEYGHAVETMLGFGCQEHRQYESCDCFLKRYMKDIRGLEYVKPESYGGRMWHLHPKEVFANDFRIAVTGLVSAYWPHECAHPRECKAVMDFWSEQSILAQGRVDSV